MATKSESSIVTKCAKVLDIISSARRPPGFVDVVEQSGLARSSAHRILMILINENLVEYDDTERIYRYGPRLNRWARGAWMQIDLHESSARVMENLCQATHMNSELSVLDRDSVLYLRTFNTIPVRFASHPGDHAPLHCTAAGKVFLAFMQKQLLEEMLANIPYERLTEFTIQDPETLLRELEITRERGYGMAVQEESLQIIGVAAPIKDLHGKVIACMSLWSLTDRITPDDAEALARQLIASTQRISRNAEGELPVHDTA